VDMLNSLPVTGSHIKTATGRDPVLSRVQMPKKGTSHYQEQVKRSLVGEFNRTQCESGLGECSNDYCDTCAKYKISINTKQTTINRLRQASNSKPDKVKKLEAELDGLQGGLESHRQTAQKSHQVYVEVMSRCVSDWKLIKELEEKTMLSDDERERLAKAQI